MTDGLGTETLEYDDLGRTKKVVRTIDGRSYTSQYLYTDSGDLKQLTYPSGRIASYGYDSVGRPSSVSSGGLSLVSGLTYNAAGFVEGLTYGNGVVAEFSFTADRLQPDRIRYTKGTTILGDWEHEYSIGRCQPTVETSYGFPDCGGVPARDAGQITRVIDHVWPGRTADYRYDALHRLSTYQAPGGVGFPAVGYTYTYDRWGNRLEATPSGSAQFVPSLTFDSSNRINSSGYSYDPLGNLSQDLTHTYVHNAANHLVAETSSSVTRTYGYSGGGLRLRRVAELGGFDLLYSGTSLIAEYPDGSPVLAEYVYLGAQRIATYYAGQLVLNHTDHLSRRLNTDSSGAQISSFDVFPFGNKWYGQDNEFTNGKQFFTTYEREYGSELDYATHRWYSPALARFLTPDPVTGSLGEPQRWNRYAYVLNDPINLVDYLGLDDDPALDWGLVDSTGAHALYPRTLLNSGSECLNLASVPSRSNFKLSVNPSPCDGGGGGGGGGNGGRGITPLEARRERQTRRCGTMPGTEPLPMHTDPQLRTHAQIYSFFKTSVPQDGGGLWFWFNQVKPYGNGLMDSHGMGLGVNGVKAANEQFGISGTALGIPGFVLHPGAIGVGLTGAIPAAMKGHLSVGDYLSNEIKDMAAAEIGIRFATWMECAIAVP